MVDAEETAPYWFGTPGGRSRRPRQERAWVAFSSDLKRSLGWSLSPEGPFRRVVPQGRVTVESLRW